ncbi:integrin alpha [Pseudoroseomonas sp. WGS1072]|uniref:integrin alpha n=1 Tax=Roseomonas sp. WGS1072 TaxID=3366816 RepID=UPI003BF254E6
MIALNVALPPHVTRLQVSQTPGFTGFALANAGDMNGDGLADLLVGAAGADHRGGGSGAAYLLYGQPEWQL